MYFETTAAPFPLQLGAVSLAIDWTGTGSSRARHKQEAEVTADMEEPEFEDVLDDWFIESLKTWEHVLICFKFLLATRLHSSATSPFKNRSLSISFSFPLVRVTFYITLQDISRIYVGCFSVRFAQLHLETRFWLKSKICNILKEANPALKLWMSQLKSTKVRETVE